MPTRADVEAATPKCPLAAGGVRCGAPLQPSLRAVGLHDWHCRLHGHVPAGWIVPLALVASSAAR
jgi:hypothetical protein